MSMSGTGVSKATPVDRSGTITLGGTAQQLLPADPARNGFYVQNVSTGDLYVNVNATASATVSTNNGSIKLGSGAYWEHPCSANAAVSIFGATTGQAFVCKTF